MPKLMYKNKAYCIGAGELDELTDVDITSPSNNDVLKYNSTSQKWENGTGGSSNSYSPDDTAETTLADDDKVPFYDTSASGKRNSTWANIKAKLKAYFDTIYAKNLYYDDLYEPSQYNTNTHKFWGRGLFNCSLEGAPNKFTDFADAIVTATNDHANTIAKLRVEKTLAEFNALTPAEQDDPEIVYYVTDKPSLGYPIQDDGTATDLTDGALATGRTIENWASGKFLKAVRISASIKTGASASYRIGSAQVAVGSAAFNTFTNYPTGKQILAYIPMLAVDSSSVQRGHLETQVSNAGAFVFGSANTTYGCHFMCLYTDL